MTSCAVYRVPPVRTRGTAAPAVQLWSCNGAAQKNHGERGTSLVQLSAVCVGSYLECR